MSPAAGKGPLLPYRAVVLFWLPLCVLATANDTNLCRRVGEGIPRLPLAPLSMGGERGLETLLAVCRKTTRIFPYHYTELMEMRPPATDLLPGRNLLLAVLWALMLSLPPGEKKEPSTARPEVS